MTSINLPKKPLVEALLELRWAVGMIPETGQLQAIPQNFVGDPNYKLALGRFSAAVEGRLPFFEQLPAASVPDELAPNVVQYRFRAGDNRWPLAQLGPGILTFNDTDSYVWADFCEAAKTTVGALRSSYPKNASPVFNRVVLKYIDAVPFDYFNESVFGFMAKLKVDARLHSELLTPLGVGENPSSLLWRAGFHTTQPVGELQIQIATAVKGEERAVMWETTISSSDEHAPNTDDALSDWLEAAHTTSSAIFLKMTSGELYESFF